MTIKPKASDFKFTPGEVYSPPPELPPLLDQLCADLKVRKDEFREGMSAVFQGVHPKPNKSELHMFMALCKEYQLDPRLKHVFAMRRNANAPLEVGLMVDGWLHVATRNKCFNAIQTESITREIDGKTDIGCRASILRFGHDPTIVEEWVSENYVPSSPQWKQRKTRLVRHRATIQGIRYAYNVSVPDADELRDEAHLRGPFIDDTQAEANEAVAAAIKSTKGGDADGQPARDNRGPERDVTSGEEPSPPTSSPDVPPPVHLDPLYLDKDGNPTDTIPPVDLTKPEDPTKELPF